MALHRSAPPPEVFRPTDALGTLIRPHNLCASVPADQPVPTNAWWGNLLAWDASAQPESDAVFAGPYTHRVVRDGLSVAYLRQYRSDGPTNDNGAARFYFYPPDLKTWVLAAAELAGPHGSTLAIGGWDDLGVHLALRPAGSRSRPSLSTYLALGSAFTTVRYEGLTPRLRSAHVILTVNGSPTRPGDRFRGQQFLVTLNNGHTWVLFAFGDALELECTADGLQASAPFSGVLQAAFVSSSADVPAADAAAVLRLYQSAAGVYPTGMRVRSETADAFAYEWTVARASPSAHPSAFLHLALWHLQEMMQGPAQRRPELVLHAHTHGPMTAYTVPVPAGAAPASAKWSFRVPQASSAAVASCLGFYPRFADGLTAQEAARLRLAEIVRDEIHGDWVLPHEGSYYFKGKLLQKWGTMCLVASKLAASTSPELAQPAREGLAKLQLLLSELASNASAFPLVYDTVYKGIITSEALSKRDVNVDFGNAVYNDHHYHYGYVVTAAAMVLHLSDELWRKSAAAVRVRSFVDALVRDVLCADDGARFFPRFRHFDWFQGHSYSHGVTPMADGKDEESTSEEVNFLYGVALYSRETENAELERLATLMLNVYARAVNTYFLLTDDSEIHPSTFGRNKVTGVFFDNKCDYTTWFSPAKECIHGIQMLPVSPIMDAVRSERFVREEWEQVLSRLDMVKHWQAHASGWTSLLFANYSLLDRRAACDVLAACPMDDGLSRAWALYVSATHRPAN